MQMEFIVGPRAVSDGAVAVPRLSRDSSQVVQDAHGRYQEAVLRGRVFSAHNSAAQAVSVALTTTYTGLMLSNPINSGRYLVLLKAGYALSVAPAGIASLHLIGGWSATAVTHTTPAIPRSNLVGGAPGVGLVDSAATIPTPLYLDQLYGGFTAAALPPPPPANYDFGGLWAVPPGGFIGIGALTAVTGFGSLTWEEVDI